MIRFPGESFDDLFRDQQGFDVAAQVGLDRRLPGRVGDPHQVADRLCGDALVAQVVHQPHGFGIQLGLPGSEAFEVLARAGEAVASLVERGVTLARVAFNRRHKRCRRGEGRLRLRVQGFG